jgi:hypothetical protein
MRLNRLAVCLGLMLGMTQGTSARAQWGFPMGFGGWGWEGWGVGTAEGDLARGLGVFAMGAGEYNKQTAVANSIDTDTVMRWNQYIHESQMNINRKRRERLTGARERQSRLADEVQKRLRESPEIRDIHRGDALNAALDDIDDPRVYVKALHAAKVKIGGELIRHIPFRYAAAAVTVGIHQLATGQLPAALRRPEFQSDLEAIKSLDQEINAQVLDDKEIDPAAVKNLLRAIYGAEENAAKILPPNSLEHKQVDNYLKALHGLLTMLKAPVLDPYLAGVEKRPGTTLGELLNFMSAFNLRFGPATTPEQREIYSALFPMLVELRNQVAPSLATSPAPTANGHEAEDFFSLMTFEDLRKKAPKP